MHTINEQLFVASSDTATEAAEKIKNFFYENFGWESEENKVYVEKDTGLAIVITASGTNISVSATNGAATTTTTTMGVADLSVYWHASEDEKVIAVEIGGRINLTIAEDDHGHFYIFQTTGSSNVTGVTGNGGAVIGYSSANAVKNEYCFSVQKMPSFVWNCAFPSLYTVFAVPTIQRRNQLVSFGGKIFRIFYSNSASSSIAYPVFAFPVSN